MSGVLVVAEARRGELRDITLELIERGRGLAARSAACWSVDARDADALDARASRTSCRAALEHFEPHLSAAAVEAAIERFEPDVVLPATPSTAWATRPRSRPSSGLASPATSRSDAGRSTRGAYGDRLVGDARLPDARALLTVRAGAFERRRGGGSAARRGARARRVAAARVEHLGFVEAEPATSTSRGRVRCSRSAAASRRPTSRALRALAERDGRDALGLAAAGRRWLDSRRAPGRPVGQDRQAEGLPGARDLRRGPAPRRHAQARDDHRRQHRPGGADLRSRHYGAVADLFDVADELERQFVAAWPRAPRRPARSSGTSRAWLEVLWYVARGRVGGVFAYGCARPVAQVPARSAASAAALGAAAGRARPRCGLSHRRSATAIPRPAGRTAACFYGFVTLFVGTVILGDQHRLHRARSSAGGSSTGDVLPRLLARPRRARPRAAAGLLAMMVRRAVITPAKLDYAPSADRGAIVRGDWAFVDCS